VTLLAVLCHLVEPVPKLSLITSTDYSIAWPHSVEPDDCACSMMVLATVGGAAKHEKYQRVAVARCPQGAVMRR
jgi:hypothetical protein